jgi:hypothetical protein
VRDRSGKEADMNFKMGRMTKRNRAKYRRRAYEAGMLRNMTGSPTMPSRLGPSIGGTPRGLDNKRAA